MKKKALVPGRDQSRLQAVFAKAQKSEKVTLGVIGGSITRTGAKIASDKRDANVMFAWFDKTWGGYRNMKLIDNKLSPGKHLVGIELLTDKNQNSSGNEFRVLCLGSTGIDHN